MKELWSLFLTFAKVGVMTFGGGYAMLPILQREVVENKGWATDEELTDYFAIGQCTPGVIAVNTATFIGQKHRGIIGGIVATLGVVFPSLIIIAALAGVIDAFSHLAWVQHAFAGIRVCVCVLIFNAVVKLWKGAIKDKTALVLFVVIFLLSVFLDVSPVVYVIACAAAGIFLTLLGEGGLRRKLTIGAVLHLRPNAHLIDHSVIVLLRMFRSDGVARRIIEYQDVAELHFAQSAHASVVPMRPFKIAARASDRHGVLRQRHGERRLRDARSVGEFGNEEIVARQQCFLQRRRRNHEVLEEKLVEEIDGNEGKDDGVNPAHHEADGAVLGVFPPSPVDKFAHVDVVDERHDEESPPRANPIEEEEVESEHDAELDVTASAGRYILEKHVVDCGLFFQESAK